MKKTTLALSAGALFVGALLFMCRTKKDDLGPPGSLSAAVDRNLVTAVQVSGAHRWRLSHSPGGWKVQVDGTHHPAEEALLKEFFGALQSFRAEKVISDDASRHKEFEVDEEGGVRLRVFFERGAELDLVFGRQAKPGESYVRSAANNRVFITQSTLPLQLRREASTWRRQRLFDFQAESLARLSVEHADGEKWAMVKEGATWVLSSDVVVTPGFRLSPSFGERVSAQLAFLLAQGYLAGDTSLSSLGLAPPLVRVSGTLKNGASIEVALGRAWSNVEAAKVERLNQSFREFDENSDGFIEEKELRASALGPVDSQLFSLIDAGGRPGEKGDGRLSGPEIDFAWRMASEVPARLNGEGEVFSVSRSAAQLLGARLDDMRDLALLRTRVEQLSRWELASKKAKVRLERQNDTWKMLEPGIVAGKSRFDAGKVEAELRTLARLTAPRRARNGEVKEAAFSPPTMTVVFVDRGGKTEKLIFGREVVGEWGEKEVYVKGALDADVYVVPFSLQQRLEQGVALFQ